MEVIKAVGTAIWFVGPFMLAAIYAAKILDEIIKPNRSFPYDRGLNMFLCACFIGVIAVAWPYWYDRRWPTPEEFWPMFPYFVALAGICAVAQFREWRHKRATKAEAAKQVPVIEPERVDTPVVSVEEYARAVMSKINTARPLMEAIIGEVIDEARNTPERTLSRAKAHSDFIVACLSVLPPASLIKAVRQGPPGPGTWDAYIRKETSRYKVSSPEWNSAATRLLLPFKELKSLTFDLQIPRDLRGHMHVVASTGWGKSQLFTNLVIEDFEHDNAVVVIDSQDDLINSLATRVPPERLVLIDPMQCAPIINPMSLDNDATGLALIEYMFNTNDAPLTSQQKMVFRFVGGLVLASDKPHIASLLAVLRNPETVQFHFAGTLARQTTVVRDFFTDYCAKRSPYSETREQVARRVFTVIQNDVFQKMLGVEEQRFNIQQAIAHKKIILINTAKSAMGDAATLFGRFWIAQVLRTVMKVPDGKRSPVFVYLDEFQDYAEDSSIMLSAFEQGRKYGLAMTIAHQGLSQLPDKLEASLMSNCAIRMAGGVSPEDRNRIAKQMDLEPDQLSRTRGTFTAWFRDMGAYPFPVQFGQLNALPEVQPLATIHALMRRLYGPTLSRPQHDDVPPSHDEPPPDPSDDRKRGKQVDL